jgi:hypothetical protein
MITIEIDLLMGDSVSKTHVSDVINGIRPITIENKTAVFNVRSFEIISNVIPGTVGSKQEKMIL